MVTTIFDVLAGLLWCRLWWSDEESSKLWAWRHHGFAPSLPDVEQGGGGSKGGSSLFAGKKDRVHAPRQHGAGDNNFLGLARSEEEVACEYEQYQTSDSAWINSWWMRSITPDVRVASVLFLTFSLPFFAPLWGCTGPTPFMIQRFSILAGAWYLATRGANSDKVATFSNQLPFALRRSSNVQIPKKRQKAKRRWGL